MNKLRIRILSAAAACCFCAMSQFALADDPPPPPPPGGGHGSTGNQGPMGAPIDGGLTIFLAFAAGYAGREWYKGRQRKLNEVE